MHPDGTHVVHALGTSVVVMELATGRQRFLTGHSHNVSCVDVSRSGKYIASGQVNFMGFRVGRAQTVQWRGGVVVVVLVLAQRVWCSASTYFVAVISPLVPIERNRTVYRPT